MAGVPSPTAVATGENTIEVSWPAIANADGYDIERDGTVIAQDYESTLFEDSGLLSGTTYTYRVRSVGPPPATTTDGFGGGAFGHMPFGGE